MTEEDYKDVIASYQQKAFDLFNQNIVYETQINTLKKNIAELQSEIQVLKSRNRESNQDSY
jgi:vacuolar-type H+-ATPase subunit I/STV1